MAAEPKTFIPVQEPLSEEPLQEAAPKRRRGRPPRDPNAEPTPRRGRRPRINLETRIGAFLTRTNIPFMIAATVFPQVIHPEDPLTAPEIVALSKALTNQAAQHPTFRRYLEAAMGVSEGTDLVFVLGAIGVKRAANHGIVPTEIGMLASAALSDPNALAAMFGGEPEPSPEPKDVTPEPDRAFEAVGAE
jgi:hypothetical protein